MRTFTEFNLLSNKDAERFLAIMNIFLRESENLNFKLLPDEIYHMLDDVYLYHYDLEDLTKDLRYLCKNNNIKCQDENPFGIRTLEAYKNRKKYYSITSSGIAFTRAIKEYLSSAYRQKIVSEEYFKRVDTDLKKLENIKEKEIFVWWDIFVDDCTKLFQSYQDYINQFNSEEFNNLYDKVDFLNYKNDFITSINQMISNLGDNARSISEKINANFSTLKKIVKKVSEEKEDSQIGILINGQEEIFKNEVLAKWENIKNWFLYENGEQPTYLTILDYTTSIIGRIMKRTNVLSKVETSNKKNDELLSNVSSFYECISLDEAARLYVEKYGVQNICHILSDHQDNNLCEDYENGTVLSYRYEKLSRTRNKTFEVSFEENRLERERTAFSILKKQKEMEDHLLRFKKNGKLKLSNIKVEISQKEIELLLKWISNGMRGKGQTEDGCLFTMTKGNEEICLRTESGNLYINDYCLDFGEEK
ncbi:MAG: DUF2397 family protein [Eubacteriales bacterium]|nr:DUF2397 family protein [Eubacteriales bacterium]